MLEFEGRVLTRGEKPSLLCIAFVAPVRVKFRQRPYDVFVDFILRSPVIAQGYVLSPTVNSFRETECSLTIVRSARRVTKLKHGGCSSSKFTFCSSGQ